MNILIKQLVLVMITLIHLTFTSMVYFQARKSDQEPGTSASTGDDLPSGLNIADNSNPSPDVTNDVDLDDVSNLDSNLKLLTAVQER